MLYTKGQIETALQLLDKLKSPKKVIDILGYPSSPMLYHWRDKYPEYVHSPEGKHFKHASTELKNSIVKRCLIDGESVKLVAKEIGYDPTSVYGWCRTYRKKGLLALMKQSDLKPSSDSLSEEDITDLKAQMHEMQMEIDILKETINVIKKDPGVDWTVLKNREKAVMIDALRNKYSLPALCKKLKISRSSYYYQEKVMHQTDKYADLRKKVIQLFNDNRRVFGYRKIQILLHKTGIFVSDKVIRRIMKEEGLSINQRRSRKRYNSYRGEITPGVENIVNRDFHAEKPNQKWVTDITEFSIKAGKVYLSPIIDCFDGMPVNWKIGTSPNAEMAYTMLEDAISRLSTDEKPIVHTNRGCQYRVPEWIKIMDESGLTRSMSKKGCTPDNAACEGFFGHLKTEMFYGHNWDSYSIADFIREVEDYLKWYCTKRIKSTLGGLSPLDYRRRLGVAV